MNLDQKLTLVQKQLPKNRFEEREIINQLMILLKNDSNNTLVLPKKFHLQTTLNTLYLRTFLKNSLELNIKELTALPNSFFLGKTYEITLN